MTKRASLILLLVFVCGCQTYEYTKHGGNTTVRHINDEEDFEDTPEGVLVAQAEERDDAKSWWKLGDFYERERRWREAIGAYELMQARIAADTKNTGRDYVGGYYLLGKCYAMRRDFQPAIGYLRAVLEKQPKNYRDAFLNPYFREAHFLLGAIYFEHRMFEDARTHLETFKELSGGDTERRADPLLIKIEDAVGPPPPRSTPAAARKDAPNKDAPNKDADAPKPDAPPPLKRAAPTEQDAPAQDGSPDK